MNNDDIYVCPKCSSRDVYWLMPAATPAATPKLKCWDCKNTWAFRFLVFIGEWKGKVTA